jgi:hypothetical protein
LNTFANTWQKLLEIPIYENQSYEDGKTANMLEKEDHEDE